MPNVIRISETDASRLRNTRPYRGYTRDRSQKRALNSIFAEFKRRYGLPDDIKLKVEIDDRQSPEYLVLKDKRHGTALHELAATPHAQVPATRSAPAPVQPGLRVGSISLANAQELLRADGDDYESYADSTRVMNASVVVEGDRVYFVL